MAVCLILSSEGGQPGHSSQRAHSLQGRRTAKKERHGGLTETLQGVVGADKFTCKKRPRRTWPLDGVLKSCGVCQTDIHKSGRSVQVKRTVWAKVW